MKKLLAIVLAAACAVSMAACAAKTGGIITLPEASMTDGQLAAPPEVTSVPYPKETDYVKNGTVDYDAYDKAYDDWQAARQEKLQKKQRKVLQMSKRWLRMKIYQMHPMSEEP